MESHDDQCEWCSEACGCDSRASLHGLLRKAANDIEVLQKQLAAAKEDAEYAWRNVRILEAARVEEMRKRDEAVATSARLCGLLIACRSSVKIDMLSYEKLLLAKEKHGEQETSVYVAAADEVCRLFQLLKDIDRLELK